MNDQHQLPLVQDPLAQRLLPGFSIFESPELRRAALIAALSKANQRYNISEGSFIPYLCEILQLSVEETTASFSELCEFVYQEVGKELIKLSDGSKVTDAILITVSEKLGIPTLLVKELNSIQRHIVVSDPAFKGFGEG